MEISFAKMQFHLITEATGGSPSENDNDKARGGSSGDSSSTSDSRLGAVAAWRQEEG